MVSNNVSANNAPDRLFFLQTGTLRTLHRVCIPVGRLAQGPIASIIVSHFLKPVLINGKTTVNLI